MTAIEMLGRHIDGALFEREQFFAPPGEGVCQRGYGLDYQASNGNSCDV